MKKKIFIKGVKRQNNIIFLQELHDHLRPKVFFDQKLDFLFIDECISSFIGGCSCHAGKCAKNIILVGDQQQLGMPN